MAKYKVGDGLIWNNRSTLGVITGIKEDQYIYTIYHLDLKRYVKNYTCSIEMVDRVEITKVNSEVLEILYGK